MSSIRHICALTALVVACAVSVAEQHYPWLDDLDANEGARASGARLMALGYGLHPLEQTDTDADVLLIGAHGYASRGYEWVYPLQTLNRQEVAAFFYRWDFGVCPAEAAGTLTTAIEDLLRTRPALTRVALVGHSYGGVMATVVADRWTLDVPIEVHAIAAPLAGAGDMAARCDYAPPSALGANVTFYEWRTRHEIDGAFKDINPDPQVVVIPRSNVTRLPETYRGRRLGHNWSISWVADEIVANRLANAPPRHLQ